MITSAVASTPPSTSTALGQETPRARDVAPLISTWIPLAPAII